jgi:Domain of unknown function (DUF4189)
MTRLLLLLLILVFSKAVFAEGNCPEGYFDVGGGNAGFSGCAPIYNSDLGSGTSYSPNPPNPGPRWKFRWGAIAVDGEKGKFAGVDGLATPSKASKAAIKQCRRNGGKHCEILIEYHNQCGALVWGDNQYAGFYGALLDDVTARALKSCSSLVSNCKIYYTGCSYPVEAD